MTWWNLGVAGVLFICYLIYAIKNKEFLAFTLSKKYFLSLFLGMFLGSSLSAGDRMLKFISYYLGNSIVFAITFSVIFSIAKDIRNVKNIEIETNNKFFNINLRFILLICFFYFLQQNLIFGLE